MLYEIRCNSLIGCLEAVALAGTEKATIGCIWNSTDEYASIKDCNGCYLANIDAQTVAIGKDTTALNNSIAIGCGNTTTCDGIAIGNQLTACAGEVLISDVLCTTCMGIALGKGACIVDNGIAIGANLTACCDEILIGDKVAITDNTVINGCDSGCSNVVAINATATDNCQVVINGLVDVTCASVTLGCVATVNTKVALGDSTTAGNCGVAIGNGATAAACSTAIGNGACAACGIDIKGGCSEVILNFNNTVTIGTSNTVCNAGNTVIGTAICAGSGTTDTVIIGQANMVPDACNISEAVVIGDLGEIGVDYTGSISSGDVILGGYLSGPFKYCASNGYTYSNECLMTGRIIDCADLPASNCENILFVVP